MELKNAADFPLAPQNNSSASNSADFWTKLDNAILAARAHLIHSNSDLNNANSLVHSLSEMLERVKEETKERPQQEDLGEEGDDEPIFESMILCNGGSLGGRKRSIQLSTTNSILPMERKRSSAMNLKKRSMIAPAPLQGMSILEGNEAAMGEREPSIYFVGSRKGSKAFSGDPEGVEEDWTANKLDPILLRSIPHIAIISVTVLWLFIGAVIFRCIDPQIAEKPFHRAFLYSFELCASIGWGDTRSTNSWSQCFCIVFTLFGIPFLFSAFANLGRLITEFYCVDWLFLSAVVRRKQSLVSSSPHRRRFPLRLALNLLFLHQCLGVLLYSGLFHDFPVVASIYFSITSMATIGLGDFTPEPANWAETLIAIVYFSSGIILLSALYLSIAYHFQTIFYISMQKMLHKFYIRYWKRRAKGNEGDGREKKENAF